MRLSTSALVLGAASTAAGLQDQQVLMGENFHQTKPFGQIRFDEADSWMQSLEDAFGSITSEAKATWDEVSMLMPDAVEAFKKHALPKGPKPHTRKPDSDWDFVTKGADVEGLTVMGADGTETRQYDGQLSNYDVRVKKVDPSKLGVDTVKQYSGYLDDNEKDKHLFYWFFESRNDPKKDPVILWLNGGPGCSSMMGLLLELGPATVNEQGKIIRNDYSWNNNASVIFIDQPVNTGYSYGSGTVSDSLAAAKDVYALLTLFFHQFPEYATQDFHIAGESYGGHYVPAIASEILSHKKRNINLQSIAIGNGLTDEYTQYAYYGPMACGEGGYPAVLDETTCGSLENALPRCQSLIKSCYNSESPWSCVPASIYCNNAMLAPYQRTGRNVYDVRTDCEGGNLCYKSIGWVTDFLRKPETMEALGVEVSSYDSCNFDINRDFLMHGDWMKPMHRLMPNILSQIPVLIYAGDADFICNWLGNRAWTDALEWDGHDAYAKAETKDLITSSSKDAYGKVKSSGHLTFIQVFEAGHMTPMDQPEASLDFLNRWINGEWSG